MNHADTNMLVATERLFLKVVQESDVTAAYVEALNDPEVVRFTEARHVRWTRETVLDYVRRSNQDGISQLLGIFLKDSGRHIGNIRLFNFSEAPKRVEIGFMIFDKSQWSKGYATEAVEAVSDWLFRALGFHRICADYYSVNIASAKVFAKAGFQTEGVFRDHFSLAGKYVDSVRVAKLNQYVSGARDPQRTKRIPSAGPSITDKEVQLVAEAAKRGWYENMRLYIDEFEKRFSDYTGMKYCLATNTCTAALHLAFLSLGIGPGDEVVVPDITWVASAAPICYTGATPVFADIEPKSLCLSAESFKRAVTERTKAVVMVDLIGNMPDVEQIISIASQHNIVVVEDAAESIGAEFQGRMAGTIGKVGVYSFNGTKLLVTGQGGMIVTNEEELYERLKRLYHHGIIRKPGERYYWSHELGHNYQMTNLQAALGVAQLSRIQELVEARRRLFRWYQERLKGVEGIQLNQQRDGTKSTFWLVTAFVTEKHGITKEEMVEEFHKNHIDARPFFYPLSSMPPFSVYCSGRDMRKANPVSYALSPYGICLPSAFSLTEADVDFVCATFRKILSRRKTRRSVIQPGVFQ